jgi:hypothetical protein
MAAPGPLAEQIGLKAPTPEAPVRTVWTKRTPSAPKPFSPPVQVVMPLTALVTDWLDAMTSPAAAVQLVVHWIRPDCCGPGQALSAASLRIRCPPSEQIV